MLRSNISSTKSDEKNKTPANLNNTLDGLKYSKEKRVLIGGAWPYANGPLHMGHIAALLPGDVLARYFRLNGANVLYVSGSDCHGTPISMRAEKEGVDPSVIADKYHNEFEETFNKLGFSYDVYTKTSDSFHKKMVQDFFTKLYDRELLYIKTDKMPYCDNEKRFLPDRFVIGICYECGSETKGDQCDNCNTIIEPKKLIDIKCNSCGNTPEFRETQHLYFKLSKFQNEIENLVKNASTDTWRKNAIQMTKRYLKEGLLDRATSRDLDWGIDIPIEGFEDKKIYVWFEAVLGYVTASAKWFNDNGKKDDWEKFWGEGLTSYYVHGKDNIPFHSVILPSLLSGLKLSLPTNMTASEYLTIEGGKLSTSKNWAIWVNDYLKSYDPDPLRYFLIMNGPEYKDSDFSWREYFERNNGELLGAYGNLVNRTLSMNIKYFGKAVPAYGEYTKDDIELLEKVKKLYDTVGAHIEKSEFKKGLECVFEVIRNTNKYIDTQAPWTTIKTDVKRTATILKVCMDSILNISSLTYPFIPQVSGKALSFLNHKPAWRFRELEIASEINEPTILVKRLDKSIIEEEVSKLGKTE